MLGFYCCAGLETCHGYSSSQVIIVSGACHPVTGARAMIDTGTRATGATYTCATGAMGTPAMGVSDMGNGYLVKVVLCGLDQGIARRLAKGVKVVSFVSANFKREKKRKTHHAHAES